MGALWEKIDGKQLALIVTSVGGILLAGLILYFYSQATNNHIEHGFSAVSDAIKEHNQEDMEVKRELISTLKDTNKAIVEQREAIRDLQLILPRR